MKNIFQKKQKKKKKIKKISSIPKIIKSLNDVLINSKKLKEKEFNEPSYEKKVPSLKFPLSISNSKINKNRLFLGNFKKNNLNKSNFSNELQNLITEKKKIEILTENYVRTAPTISRKEIIKNFTNLGENIYRIKDLFINSSQNECDEFFSAKKELGLSFKFHNEKSEESQNQDFFAELKNSHLSEKSEKQKHNMNSLNFNRLNSFNSKALKSVKLLEEPIDIKDFNINDFNITHNESNGKKIHKFLKRRTTNLKGTRGGFKRFFKTKNTVDLSVHRNSIEEFNENFLRQNSERSNNFDSILSYKSKKNYDIQDVKYNFK